MCGLAHAARRPPPSSVLISHRRHSMIFEENFKQPTAKLWAMKDVLPMLTPYSTDAIRDRITLIYRGYDLELTRLKGGVKSLE